MSVFEALWAAGQPFGLAHAGYRAIDSARLEKGYLYWSGDLSPDYNPYEAGLGFCVALDKGPSLGRGALLKVRADGVAGKLVSFTVEGFAPLHGGEAIVYKDNVIGYASSAGYGHTLRQSTAFGYLPTAMAAGSEILIEAFGPSYPARRGPGCL